MIYILNWLQLQLIKSKSSLITMNLLYNDIFTTIVGLCSLVFGIGILHAKIFWINCMKNIKYFLKKLKIPAVQIIQMPQLIV